MKINRRNINQITEGAMIVGLIGIIMILDRYLVGLVESFFFWALPIPLALYAVKHGFRNAVVLATSLIIVAFLLATWQMLVLIVFSIMTGVIYGSLIKKEVPLAWVLLVTFVITYAYQFLSTYLLAAFFNYNLDAEINSLAQFFINLPQVIKFFPKIDRNQLLNFFRLLMPIVVLVISVVQTYLTHFLTSILLIRLNIKRVEIIPINQARISKVMGLQALILMLAGYWFYSHGKNQNIQNIALIIALINTMVFLTFGMILVNVYSAYKDYLLLPFISVFLLFLMPYIIILLGIVDIFTNIREVLVRRMVHERKDRSL